MNIFSFLTKKKRLKVFHVGYKRMDNKTIMAQKIEYHFFPTKPFIEDDNIIGMYSRIYFQLQKVKPDIILLQFNKPQMINDREEEMFLKFGIVLKLSDA